MEPNKEKWKIEFSRKTLKDIHKLQSAGLSSRVKELVAIIKSNPYQPPYEKLTGNLKGYYSRRINIKHRLVYSIDNEEKIVRVISVWTHYE